MNRPTVLCSIIRRTLNRYQPPPPCINPPRCYVTSAAVPHVSDIESLRATSAATFAKSDYADICWAGVFGSFGRNTHTDQSDVDVVVWRKSALEGNVKDERPLFPAFLEDELPRLWNRDVDVVSVTDHVFRGYVAIESLLCSQTLYGSSKDEGVRDLRRAAARVLDEGRDQCAEAVNLITDIQAMLNDATLDMFLTSHHLRQSVDDRATVIFDNLLSKPQHHPMYAGFWYVSVELVHRLQKRLNDARDEEKRNESVAESKYWKELWDISTSRVKKDGLKRVAWDITNYVTPVIEETYKMRDMVSSVNPSELR